MLTKEDWSCVFQRASKAAGYKKEPQTGDKRQYFKDVAKHMRSQHLDYVLNSTPADDADWLCEWTDAVKEELLERILLGDVE